jgi:MFS family permease
MNALWLRCVRMWFRVVFTLQWLLKHRTFLAVCTYYYVNGLMWPSIASRIPAIASEDHLTAELLGLALLGQAVGLASAMFSGGRLYRRWGARRVALISGIAYTGATALPGWAPNALTLFGALVFWGVANAPLDAAQNMLAAKLPKPAKGSIMAQLELAFSAGMLTGAGLGAGLAGWLSPRIHLSIVAGAGIALVILAATLLPKNVGLVEEETEAPWRPHLPRHGAIRRRGPDTGPRHSSPRTYRIRRIGYRRPLGRLALLSLLGLWLEAVVPDWSGLFLQHQLGAGSSVYGLGNVCFFVALTAVQIPAGTVLPQRLQMSAVAAGGLWFAGGMLLATLGPGLPAALAGFALCGAGAAIIQPFAMEEATRLFGGSSQVVQRVQGPGYLGLSFEKPFTGFFAGLFGYGRALQTTIVLGAIVCAVGLTMVSAPPDAAGQAGAPDAPDVPDVPFLV